MLKSGQIDKIILSRPAVEAGERLGFLPGDLKEKIDPYLRPIYDALNDMLSFSEVLKKDRFGLYRDCTSGVYERKNIIKCFYNS